MSNKYRHANRKRKRRVEEVPRDKRSWSIKDLKVVNPITENQKKLFDAFFNNKNIVASGTAGTGKTYLAFYLAFVELLENTNINSIIILRSAVPTRNIGFTPGTLEEKMAVYEAPYRDICANLFKGRISTYDNMKKEGYIEFMSTSYIRGSTWNNTVVIVEEVENMNSHEINSIMTRLGKYSKIIFTGDYAQTDLRASNDRSGIKELIDVTSRMKSFNVINFSRDDIVRSPIVKEWIIAKENYG